jgi:hypothetical protein
MYMDALALSGLLNFDCDATVAKDYALFDFVSD